MRKKQIIILEIVMSVALLGLVFTQAGYFQTAFQLKKTQFDYLVNKSINETISVLSSSVKIDFTVSIREVIVLSPKSSFSITAKISSSYAFNNSIR